MDKMIAERCPDVDVVIGGHSHTFLYTGSPPDIEKPEGNYPTIVINPNGRQVPVLQAYAFTKYMGFINLVVRYFCLNYSCALFFIIWFYFFENYNLIYLFAFTFTQLQFDDYGHLTNYSGKPILLDKSIPHHADIMSILDAKRQQVDLLDAKDIKDRKSRIKMFFSEETKSNSPDFLSSIINISVFMFLIIIFVCNDRHV